MGNQQGEFLKQLESLKNETDRAVQEREMA